MKNFNFVLLLAMVACHCGCASKSEKIVFLSETPMTHLDSVVPPKKLSLTSDEIRQIERQSFERLLNGHFGDDGDYTAIFLEADEAETAVFIKKFPKHHPPVKQLWHANVRPGFTPLDKDSGKPAMIFNIEVGEPENGTVTAVAKWYAGDAVKGFYIIPFHQTESGWTPESQ